MEHKFKYHTDKITRKRTWIICTAIVLIFVMFFLLQDGYIRAWMLSIMTALLLLYIMSIPRYIAVTRDAVEIHCVVELTRIEINDIQSIRKITRKDLGKIFPVLGSYGFFGYYGYYANIRKWDTIKVYATEWGNLVEIEDIFEDKYVVSCRDADRLIETVMQGKLAHAGEDVNLPPEE